MKRWILQVLFICSSPYAYASGDTLGRLFFSPEERREMDQPSPVTVEEKKSAATLLTLQGTVQSSLNRSWIIGKTNDDLSKPLAVSIRTGQAQVKTKQGSKDIKVGQTINIETGLIEN